MKTTANTPLPESVKMEFAKRLHDAMVKKGWNQAELARQAQKKCRGGRFGRDSVSFYMRAKMLPRADHLNALCKALEVEPEMLLPSRGDKVDNLYPALDMRDLGNGTAHLRVNRAVDFKTGLKIMEMLNAAV